MHLYNSKDPNNLNQIINFSETQNTENIANVQYVEASYVYDLNMTVINSVVKDYLSIAKYGEKMMQPFTMIGITNPTALQYAAKMRMAKYNRKALSNIRVTLQGEPCLKMDQYAYIKSLRKLFYIESYSHSYTAGDNLTTSLNGTYTRNILCLLDLTSKWNEQDKQLQTKAFQKQLEEAATIEDTIDLLQKIDFPENDILTQKVYQMYVDNLCYPAENEDLKQEIGALYNKNSIRFCYLDGFLWEIPFDTDPYLIAKQIQDDEQRKLNRLSKILEEKKQAQQKTNKANIKETKNISKGNMCPVKHDKKKSEPKQEPPKVRSLLDLINYNKYIRIQKTKKFSCPLKKEDYKGK